MNSLASLVVLVGGAVVAMNSSTSAVARGVLSCRRIAAVAEVAEGPTSPERALATQPEASP
jgi:hypothetical protein